MRYVTRVCVEVGVYFWGVGGLEGVVRRGKGVMRGVKGGRILGREKGIV